MSAILEVFAGIYRNSASGRRDTVNDYTIDWEKLLRAAGRDDGEERELAVQELLSAEEQSGGLFVIDRHPRSRQELRLRLKREGGEAWLFAAVGLSSPTGDRNDLAAFFRRAMAVEVPAAHAESWRRWLMGLVDRSLAGGSLQPFKRGDAEGNAALLRALAGVLNWREESLIRYASATLCGDSKYLERTEARLQQALREITQDAEVSLEDFGISDAPRSVLVHGPLSVETSSGRIDIGLFSGPVRVSAIDLERALEISCGGRCCLTVENESVFLELAKRRTGLLLVQTSFPGSATRLLFERLPKDLQCHHFGDTDPSGFDILRDLREKTGRLFKPACMQFRPAAGSPVLTAGEVRCIERLLATQGMSDVREPLRRMLEAGSKGMFEQESVPLDLVIGHIKSC